MLLKVSLTPMVPEQHNIPWKRFWCSRGNEARFDDGGFLADPERHGIFVTNEGLCTLDQLASTPCLVLLGEPGMGKSAEMKLAQSREESSRMIDLRTVGDQGMLYRKLFDTPWYRSWLEGSDTLTLFVESLDECLLPASILMETLAEELRQCPVNRLHLRIACRTAEWPTELETTLRSLWSEDAFRILELMPLRRMDVRLAASHWGISGDDFLAQIIEKGGVPFAAKPVTLHFLLRTAAEGRPLPATQRELYDKGCRILCEESRASYVVRELLYTDDRRRFDLACRIAAALQFCGRFAVFTGTRASEAPVSSLPIVELCEEGITEREVRETLDTALFSGRGKNLLGFAHQTYGEFLAAHYILRSELVPADHIRLIATSDALVPQLAETATWLAGEEPTVRDFLMQHAPTTLLRSDVLKQDTQLRANLIEKICKDHVIAEDVAHRYWQLSHLRHAGLATQLRPFLSDAAHQNSVRTFALVLADDCKCDELLPEIVAIALNRDEDMYLRQRACWSICRFGHAKARQALRPLAEGQAGEDLRDELKSSALEAMWPNQLSAADLFHLLPSPASPHFAQRYSWFCSPRHGLEHLTPSDLPSALTWVQQEALHDAHFYDAGLAIREILQQSIDHLDAPSVLDCLADVVFTHQHRLNALFSSEDQGRGFFSKKPKPLTISQEERQRLLDALMNRSVAVAEKIPDRVPQLHFIHPLLITSNDAKWIAARLEQTPVSETWRRLHIVLALHIFRWGWEGDLAALLAACAKHPDLAKRLDEVLTPVRLNSARAKRMRHAFRRELRQRAAMSPQKYLGRGTTMPNDARTTAINRLLREIESGHMDAFIQLNGVLDRTSSGRGSDGNAITAVEHLPGWEAINDATKERIVVAAEHYLHTYVPEYDDYTKRVFMSDEPIFCGYRALQLLRAVSPATFNSLPVSVWQKWAPATLFVWAGNTVEVWEQHVEMLAEAYRNAPEAFRDALLQQIDVAIVEGSEWLDLERLKLCWDASLIQALKDKASTPGISLPTLCALLKAIFQQEFAGSDLLDQALATGLERLDALAAGSRRERLTLARILALSGRRGAFPALRQIVQRDAGFGRQLLEAIAHQDRHTLRSLAPLNENELAELYEWLEWQYPHTKDPKFEGAHVVTPRISVIDYRDRVVAHLRDRGTAEAIAALAHLEKIFPTITWLAKVRRDAEALFCRTNWEPLTPEELFTLVHVGGHFPLRNAADLQRNLILSLERAQVRLHGETSMAYTLWENGMPRGEEALSDFVADHLKQDLRGRGIVVSREVQIRRKVGAQPGQDIDIHVTAVLRRSGETVRCIIETKGCWNSEWKTGMKRQLAGRYLEANDCRYGIFLVGWFAGKQSPSSSTKLGLATTLEMQAKELAADGVFIIPFVLDASVT
jgi:hypothetical protein